MSELIQSPMMDMSRSLSGNVLTTKFDKLLGWARKYSLFQYPFVTACCGMEFMSTACSHYDIDRFGAAFPRFSPRQADVIWVVGTISHKIAPILKTVYEQTADPKWVVSFGACAPALVLLVLPSYMSAPARLCDGRRAPVLVAVACELSADGRVCEPLLAGE